MKNIFSRFLSVAVVVFFAVSCNSSETYADKLREERKQIDAFFSQGGIEILNTYPSDGVFEENQFFRDPDTGVYINVVDSGNGNRASESAFSDVYLRFWDTATLPIDQSNIETTNDNASGVQPIAFVYGNRNTYFSASNADSYSYIYLSPGITVPLKYVGENAVVRLIVPFAQGSAYQNLAYQAIYYGRLKYTRIIN